MMENILEQDPRREEGERAPRACPAGDKVGKCEELHADAAADSVPRGHVAHWRSPL